MKRSVILVLALVLTALVFTGCRKKTPGPTTEPTMMPTVMPSTAPSTTPTTAPTTRPSTAPTTQPTVPSENETMDGGLDATGETDGNSSEKSRRAMPRGF